MVTPCGFKSHPPHQQNGILDNQGFLFFIHKSFLFSTKFLLTQYSKSIKISPCEANALQGDFYMQFNRSARGL